VPAPIQEVRSTPFRPDAAADPARRLE
jgi:hypothetical protein